MNIKQTDIVTENIGGTSNRFYREHKNTVLLFDTSDGANNVVRTRAHVCVCMHNA